MRRFLFVTAALAADLPAMSPATETENPSIHEINGPLTAEMKDQRRTR